MRIAIINAPNSRLLPSERKGDDSLGIWSVQVARRLSGTNTIFMYGGTGKRGFPASVEEEGGIRYRGISAAFETRLSGLLSRFAKAAGIVKDRLPFISTRLYHPLYFFRAALDIRKRKCDVIHVMNFSAFLPLVRTLNPRSTIVLHMHCEWLTQLDPRIVARRIAAADLIIGCSEYISRKIRNAFPETEGKCFTVWNGTDPETFTPAGRRPSGSAAETPPERAGVKTGKLLFVARVSPEKGVHVLLRAFAKVRERYPSATLEIVGARRVLPGDFNMVLEQDATARDLECFYDKNGRDTTGDWSAYLETLVRPMDGAVRFLGSLPNELLPERYRNAEVFVFPSVWNEPFGMPVVEAMASGLPVVSTMSGGIPEILEQGLYGLLAERNNVDSLAGEILRVLDDPLLYDRLSESGLRQARDVFTWERTAETLLAVYRIGKTGTYPTAKGRTSLVADEG